MMKAILIAAATILQAYLLGSVDTGILVSKFVYHDDVRNHGSGAAGMTNMLRTFGKKAAAMTATGDVLKGVLAVCIGRWLFHMLPADAGVSPYLGVYLAAIFAVLGHLYPLYFGFKGGKGVLVAAGAILAIQPVLLPFLAIIFLVCLIPTGMVSLGSVAMAALYPVLTIIYGSLQGYAAGDMLVCAIGSGFMSGMVIYMHRANIQRIREGKEYRFGKHNKNKSIIKCPAACWFSGSAAGHFCLCYLVPGRPAQNRTRQKSLLRKEWPRPPRPWRAPSGGRETHRRGCRSGEVKDPVPDGRPAGGHQRPAQRRTCAQ